jgi:hypothetical protein
VQTWLLILLVVGIGASGLTNYFETMPEYYLPGFENIVNWNALYSKNNMFYYLNNSSEPADFRPYMLREFRLDLAFHAIPIADYVANPGQYGLAQNALIFYANTSSSPDEVQPVLRAMYGSQVHGTTFYNREGNPIGKMAWFGETPPAFIPSSPGEYLLDSYNRPGTWILLTLGIILVFFAVFRRSWLRRAPAWITALVDGFTRPAVEPQSQVIYSAGPQSKESRPDDLVSTVIAPPLSTVQTARPFSPPPALPALAAEAVKPASAWQPTPTAAGSQTVAAHEAAIQREDTDRPFIEIEFRLRINLPRHKDGEHRVSIPRPLRAATAPRPVSRLFHRSSEWILMLQSRILAFLAQNGWLPGLLGAGAVILAAFGQTDLAENNGPEPGIWYLVIAGLIFALISFSTSYALPLQLQLDKETEYLFPAASLRIGLACVAIIMAGINLTLLDRRPQDQSHWDIFAMWIASVVLFLLAFLPKPHFKRPALWLKVSWRTLLPLALILLAGFALRFYQLGAIPSIMEGDEGTVVEWPAVQHV